MIFWNYLNCFYFKIIWDCYFEIIEIIITRLFEMVMSRIFKKVISRLFEIVNSIKKSINVRDRDRLNWYKYMLSEAQSSDLESQGDGVTLPHIQKCAICCKCWLQMLMCSHKFWGVCVALFYFTLPTCIFSVMDSTPMNIHVWHHTANRGLLELSASAWSHN